MGYRYKKKSVYAAERDRSDAKKRNEWLEEVDSYEAEKLVFLDESGVNIDMTRHYGRAVGIMNP